MNTRKGWDDLRDWLWLFGGAQRAGYKLDTKSQEDHENPMYDSKSSQCISETISSTSCKSWNSCSVARIPLGACKSELFRIRLDPCQALNGCAGSNRNCFVYSLLQLLLPSVDFRH